MIHRLKHCRVHVDAHERCVTTHFPDGRLVLATPNHDRDSTRRARELGYQGNDRQAVWRMTAEHDLLHSLIAETEGFEHSRVLRAIADGQPISDSGDAGREERLVLLAQKLLNKGLQATVEEYGEREREAA